MILVALGAFFAVCMLPVGEHGIYEFLSWKLTFGSVDKLSKVFACIFSINSTTVYFYIFKENP